MYDQLETNKLNPQGRLLLPPGTLWERVIATTEQARQRGALHSVWTIQAFIEQNGIRFLVRIRENRQPFTSPGVAKPNNGSYAHGDDPFLPYDPTMLVADISDTHICLLNKFNVVDHHLLIITRAFEHQETLLTVRDFEALWACMAEFEGLGFYNGGKVAGASQRHKHLQIVPLPLTVDGPAVPIEPALARAEFQGLIGSTPVLPFVHAIARLEPTMIQSPVTAAAATHKLYLAMLDAVGLPPGASENNCQPDAYNLLVTRRWMFLVPRSQECCDSISVNALGFAGSLFAQDERQLQLIQEYGPLEVLRNVGLSAETTQ
jgi:ATP adenylyltransferase